MAHPSRLTGFKNFAIATWNVCTRDKDNLTNFAFQLYDVKGRGELGLADVRLLLSEIFGSEFETKPVSKDLMRRMIRFDYKGTALDAHVSLDLFMQITLGNPMMLYPAFELQRKVQEKTLGVKGWDKITARREKAALDGSFNVSNVAAIINEGKPRRASVIAIDNRHLLPLAAAHGSKKIVLAGLQRSTKVQAEGDYLDYTYEKEETFTDKMKTAMQEAARNPTGAAAAAASLAAKAVRDSVESTVELAGKAASTVAETATAIASPQTAQRRASLAALENMKAAERRGSVSGGAGAKGAESSSSSAVSPLDTHASHTPNDYTGAELNAYIAKRRASAAGEGLYAGRRGSISGGAATGAGAERRGSAATGLGAAAAAARRASAAGLPSPTEARTTDGKRKSLAVTTLPSDVDPNTEEPPLPGSIVVNRRGSVSGQVAVTTSAASVAALRGLMPTAHAADELQSPSAVEVDTSEPLAAPRGGRRTSVSARNIDASGSSANYGSGSYGGGGSGGGAERRGSQTDSAAVKAAMEKNNELIARAMRRASVNA
jgi:hypothetical protein